MCAFIGDRKHLPRRPPSSRHPSRTLVPMIRVALHTEFSTTEAWSDALDQFRAARRAIPAVRAILGTYRNAL